MKAYDKQINAVDLNYPKRTFLFRYYSELEQAGKLPLSKDDTYNIYFSSKYTMWQLNLYLQWIKW